MIMEMISILFGILILLVAEGGFGQEGGGLLQAASFLFNMPSFVIILVFTVPLLVRGGVWREFIRAFQLLKKSYSCHLSELRRTQDVLEMLQRQVFCAGILAMLCTFIMIMRELSSLAMLGPKLAVAILTVLYATVIEMLLLPLQMEVKRRIIDYMGMDSPEETNRNEIACNNNIEVGTTDNTDSRNDGDT